MPNAVGYRPQNINFKSQETALVQRAAQELGMSTHAFMRSTVLDKAIGILVQANQQGL